MPRLAHKPYHLVIILNVTTILIVAIMLMVSQAFAKPDHSSTATTLNTGVLSYQGTLMDTAGNPLTGTYEITFRIYDAPSDGTLLWEEVRSGANAVPVQQGLFNVMLGSLNPIPDTVWEAADLFMGVKIGNDSEMSPREKLTHVPAAASANVAQVALSVPDASIDTAQLVNGGVTSDKLDLGYGTACLSTHFTTNLESHQSITVPGLSLEFTLANPSTVLIWMDGLAKYDQSSVSEVSLSLAIDGSNSTTSFGWYDNVWWNVEGQRLVNLTSGTHTLSMKAGAMNAGELVIHGVSGYRTCINYLVLGSQ